MLSEEEPLLIIDLKNNRVVIPDDKHDILSQHSELFLSCKEARDVVRDGDETERLDLCPVRNLDEDLVEILIEVTLEETVLS